MKYWKRFAFFERNNLSLPLPVLNTVFPKHLFPKEHQSDANNANVDASNTDTEETKVQGDQISLAVINGAGVQIARIPTPVPSPSASSNPSSEEINSSTAHEGVNGMIHTLSTCSTYPHKFSQRSQNADKSANKVESGPQSDSTLE